MLAIEEAKLPPPTPASAAMPTSAMNGSSGLLTAQARAPVGRSRRRADTTVQLRPPNRGTAKVYGIRSVAPTSAGVETSQNISLTLRSKPTPLSCGTTMLQSAQTAKPRNSAKMDSQRLRRAMGRPVVAHWVGFSGSHPSIHRPGRCSSAEARTSSVGGAVAGPPGRVRVEVMVAPSARRSVRSMSDAAHDRTYEPGVTADRAPGNGPVTGSSRAPAVGCEPAEALRDGGHRPPSPCVEPDTRLVGRG